MPGLYLHIPFCVRKCLYCDFYSLPMGRGPVAQRLHTHAGHDASRFLDALDVELAALPAGFRPETIFIGGGTPTELSDPDFLRLFALLRARVDLGGVVEWSCESNPGTLTAAKAAILREAGVNRVSLGVQSFDARNLEFLGRIHSADEAEAGFHLLRAHGFTNINLDLMYGIPGSAPDALDRDLDRLIALGPEHAACYCLIFEDGTPLADLQRQGFVKEVDDDTELRQYEVVRALLTGAGYEHYEISNYAKPGYHSAHNTLYWSAGEYIGCGPSAHSHWKGRRFGNIRSLDQYNQRMLAGESVLHFEEQLDPEAHAREALVMYLRLMHGVTRDEFRQKTGFDYQDLCGKEIAWLTEIGMLEAVNERLRLTAQGVFVSDAVFAELI